MKPYWVSKADYEHHPVRFLAGIWEQQTGTRLTPKQFGQLRDLRKSLGEFTRDVVEWMVVPANWWRYVQRVQAQSGIRHVPTNPDIGFLLWQRTRALGIMREELRDSTAPAHISFCARIDKWHYEEWEKYLLAFAGGTPERIEKIKAAQTLTEVQLLFLEVGDDETSAGIVQTSPQTRQLSLCAVKQQAGVAQPNAIK